MQKLGTLLLVSLLFLSFNSFGQNKKFGHIDRTEVLKMMPEFKKAQSDIEKKSKQLEAEIQILLTEYKSKLEYYQTNVSTMSESIRKDKERELGQLEERIQQFQQEAQKEVAASEQALLEAIVSKVDKAVKAVAEEKGYSYIFDTSSGAVLYAPESDDITPLIKQKLGL